MAVTIRDVAREAGVSVSTVSRVRKESDPVKEAIRQQIREVVCAHNPRAQVAAVRGKTAPDVSQFSVNNIESFGCAAAMSRWR